MIPGMEELYRSQWNYIFYQDKERYLLSVICGTAGLFERNIYLNKDEADNFRKMGKDYIEELAKQVRNSPSGFQDRHVELPVEK